MIVQTSFELPRHTIKVPFKTETDHPEKVIYSIIANELTDKIGTGDDKKGMVSGRLHIKPIPKVVQFEHFGQSVVADTYIKPEITFTLLGMTECTDCTKDCKRCNLPLPAAIREFAKFTKKKSL